MKLNLVIIHQSHGHIAFKIKSHFRKNNFDKLSDLTTEYILESVARCINAIHIFNASQDDKPASLPFPSNPIAPSAMSARYAFL